MEDVEQIRSVLQAELGDSRLDGIAADHPLLRSGLINSIEIVSVTLALERAFEIRIPAAAANPENFASLNAIGDLVDKLRSGDRAFTRVADEQHPLAASLRAALRRPLLLLAVALVFAVLFDAAIGALCEGPLAKSYMAFTETDTRLYPVSGRHSQEDFAFAVSRHRIVRHNPGTGTWRIAFLGDSGTHGTWLPAEQALPAQTEAILRDRHAGPVEVYNLAYFVTSLPKDMMILAALLKESGKGLPFDTLVLTLADEYFSRPHFENAAASYHHLSLNAHLLRDLSGFLGTEHESLLAGLAQDLKSRGAKLNRQPRDWLRFHSALFHHGPFIRETLDRAIYRPAGKPRHDWAKEIALGSRPLMEPVPTHPPPRYQLAFNGVPRNEVENGVVDLLRALVAKLDRAGIPVVIYLKPKAPREWRPHFDRLPPGSLSTREILRDICQAPGCRVADARWALSGNQFTDSLAHYTPVGNRDIAAVVADEIFRTRATGK